MLAKTDTIKYIHTESMADQVEVRSSRSKLFSCHHFNFDVLIDIETVEGKTP